MQLRPTVAALSAIVAGANARIYGIALPETIKAGDEVTAIIASSNYIQSVYDVAIAFGIAPAAASFPDSMGAVLDSFYLGPGMHKQPSNPHRLGSLIRSFEIDKSNSLKNLTEAITFPDNLEDGDYIVSASLMSLYGASSVPTLTPYNVTISVGDETTEDYVSSWQQD